MASLITVNDGTSDTISPVLVLGYETERESQNIVHDIIGGGIGVTLIRPRPRSGTLGLLFSAESDAKDALDAFARETSFTLSDTDRSTVAMTFVTAGKVALSLDETTRDNWEVSVDYQEVEV